jgi:hypothetical protein
MRILPVFTALLVLTQTSCDLLVEQNRTDDGLLPFPSVIEASVYDHPDTTDRTTYLMLRTEYHYHCANYTIEYELSKKRTEYSVLLKGVLPPQNICLTAFGPAYAVVNLGVLAHGDHSVIFKIYGEVIPSVLRVRPGETSIHIPDNEWIRI